MINIRHEIIDARGKRLGSFASKSAAMRYLNRSRREWDRGWRPSPTLGRTAEMIEAQENPHTHTARPQTD